MIIDVALFCCDSTIEYGESLNKSLNKPKKHSSAVTFHLQIFSSLTHFLIANYILQPRNKINEENINLCQQLLYSLQIRRKSKPNVIFAWLVSFDRCNI